MQIDTNITMLNLINKSLEKKTNKNKEICIHVNISTYRIICYDGCILPAIMSKSTH